jgi:hypothetical protein
MGMNRMLALVPRTPLDLMVTIVVAVLAGVIYGRPAVLTTRVRCIDDLRGDMNTRFGELRGDMYARFAGVDARLDGLREELRELRSLVQETLCSRAS